MGGDLGEGVLDLLEFREWRHAFADVHPAYVGWTTLVLLLAIDLLKVGIDE